MSSKIRIFACLLFVAAVGVAGCGGDDEEQSSRGLGGDKSGDTKKKSDEGGAGESEAQNEHR